MSDPRWSDETERVVARLLHQYHCGCKSADCSLRNGSAALVVLAALADAGLLVPLSAGDVAVHPWPDRPGIGRVAIEHPGGPCRWSVAFAALPSNRVPVLELLRQIRDHDAHCIANVPTTAEVTS